MTSPLQGPESKQYKAAVALNNIALSLLERCCYRDAMETFKDSITLMKSAVYLRTGAECPSVQSITACEIDLALKRAWHRSTHPSVVASPEMLKDFQVLKMSSQANPATVQATLDKVKNQHSKAAIFCCISIDPVDFEENDLEQLDLDSNVLLFNYGIAHCLFASWLASCCDADQDIADKLRRSGFHLFRLSESFLGTRLGMSPFHRTDNSTVLLCSMLLTNTMIQLASQLHYFAVSEYYSDAFTVLLATVDAQQRMFPDLGEQAAAA